MDLEVRKNILSFNSTYARWVKDDMNTLERQIAKARIKKDGYFYKNDYARLIALTKCAFATIANYFIFTNEMCDERDTLIRALATLNAEQFKAVASLIIEPYKDINPI